MFTATGLDARWAAIAAHAEHVDRRAELAPAAVAALTEAGFFRMMTPRRFGGSESDPAELLVVLREIAGACTSTGWVAATLALNSWQLALFDPAAGTDVWSDSPDTRIASAYQHTGTLRPTRDGYVLSGRWKYVSGLAVSPWVFVGALIQDDSGAPIGHGLALVPTDTVEVSRADGAIGLRGAANHNLRIDGVHVPRHRVHHTSAHTAKRRGTPRSRLYRTSLAVLFATTLTVPLLGAAEAAYRRMVTDLRASSGTTGSSLSLEAIGAAVGRAGGEIDQATMLLERNIDLLDRLGRPAAVDFAALQSLARRNQVLAAELAVAAVDRLLLVGGRAALSVHDPLQRTWRDVHVARSHRINDLEDVLSRFGRAELGVDLVGELITV